MTFYENYYNIDALLDNAIIYVSNFAEERVDWLTRDKPECYFQMLNNNVMVPIKKDCSGHEENPINDRLRGVFFLQSRIWMIYLGLVRTVIVLIYVIFLKNHVKCTLVIFIV